MRYLYEPVQRALVGPVGTESGAAILAFVLIFGSVFIAGKIASRRVGRRVRNSVVGPMDRVLGGGFGALKGLLGATLLYLGVTLVYDTIWGRAAARPDWIAEARTYPLLVSSGDTIIGFVEARRGPAPASATRQQRAMTEIRLHDTMAREKRVFAPADPKRDHDVCLRADGLRPRPYRQCPAGGGVRRARPAAAPRLRRRTAWSMPATSPTSTTRSSRRRGPRASSRR